VLVYIIVLRAIIVTSSRVCLPRRRRRRSLLNIITSESESLRSIRAQACGARDRKKSVRHSERSLWIPRVRNGAVLLFLKTPRGHAKILTQMTYYTHTRTHTSIYILLSVLGNSRRQNCRLQRRGAWIYGDFPSDRRHNRERIMPVKYTS